MCLALCIEEYSKLLTLLGKWVEEVKREKTEEFKKSEGSAVLYNSLLEYTAAIRANAVIKRLQLVVAEAQTKFQTDFNVESLLLRPRNVRCVAAAKKLVMLFSTMNKKVKQIKTLEKDFPDPQKAICYEMQERVYRLLLLYYKTLYYAADKHLPEAYYVAQTLIEEVKKAEEYAKTHAAVVVSVKDKLFEEALGLGKIVKRLKCLLHCAHQMKVQYKLQKAAHTTEPIVKRAINYLDAFKLIEADPANDLQLNGWEMDLAKAPADLIGPTVKPKETIVAYPPLAGCLSLPLDPQKIRIVDTLPEMKALHVKPYLHDIAGTLIQFPDLSAVLKQLKDKQGGLMNKIKWLFGR
jgi:hypothetical protein